MAFQTGSQVRPELGRADVSGFARGGMAIGAGVLQGIQNYQEQKQTMQQAGQNNPKIGKALKSLLEGDYKQNDVLALSGFASSYQSTKAAMQADQKQDPTTSTQMISIGRMLERPEFSGIEFDETGKAFMEVPNKDTFMPFDKKQIPVPESIKNIPGFEDYAESRRTVPKVDANQLPDLDSDDPILLFQ
jgi:hypothetical protein